MPQMLDGFRSVLMAAANFEGTMVYQLWKELGVEFTKDTSLEKELRFQEHQNGHSGTIKYCDERDWSDRRKKSLIVSELEPANTIVLDKIIAAAKEEFGNDQFLWQANAKIKTGDFFGANAIRLPNVPHGLNDFSHINKIVFLSSLLPARDHFRFLENHGVTGEQVRRSIYYSTAYQSVMRTSIRDPKNDQPKTIIVPDRGLAEYLSGLFPGSVIEKLDAGIPNDVEPKRTRSPPQIRT